VRGVQPGHIGAQLADLGDEGLRLSHSSSISGLTSTSTAPGSIREAIPESDSSQHQASDDQGASAVGSSSASATRSAQQ
jgi:hypothetical protein